MKSLAILLVLMPLAAHADWEVRQNDDHVRFIEAPCANVAVLAQLARLGADPAIYYEAHARVGGTNYNACWTNRGISVHLVYEDGDQGVIPRGDVKKIEST